MSGPPRPPADLRLHRRQFVVGPEPLTLADDWEVHQLSPSVWLSHCPDARVEIRQSPQGRWALIGLAVQTVPGAPDPIVELERARTRTIASHYHSWAGRWLLIGGDEIHPDATALLGCHWLRLPSGAVWASSSPAAFGDLPGCGPPVGHDLHYERGLSWIAPPYGHLVGLRRLLPSGILELGSGTVRPRPLLPDGPIGRQPLSDLAEALTESMRRLPATEPKHLALTSGADSRVVLAAAVAADVEVEPFTRRAARMSIADRVLPPALAADVGLGHRELLRRPVPPQRWSTIRTHCDGTVARGDVQPLLDGTRDGLRGIEIGGQGFGVGKAANRHLPARFDDPVTLAETVGDLLGEPPGSPNRNALVAWLAEVQADRGAGLDLGLDWRDRFYLEQRMTGWQAAKEQVYDLYHHERFFPINAARSYALLLAGSEGDRGSGQHQRELLGLLDARLLGRPINPPSEHFALTRRIRHLLTVDPGRAGTRAAKAIVGAGRPGRR